MKHKDVILAMLDGKDVQYRLEGDWVSSISDVKIINPIYCEEWEWRINPNELDLLNCPFCGSDDVSHYQNNGDDQCVECSNCLASSGSFVTADEAIASWNNRSC